MGGDVIHYAEGSGGTAWYSLHQLLFPASFSSNCVDNPVSVGPAVRPHIWLRNI